MTHTEITLAVLLYIVMGLITFTKQTKSSKHEYTAPEAIGFIAGLFWPVTITWYGIKAVFFRDWF